MTLEYILPLIDESNEVQLLDLDLNAVPEGHYNGKNSIDSSWNAYEVHGICVENNIIYITLVV